jgi:hypothetical protein
MLPTKTAKAAAEGQEKISTVEFEKLNWSIHLDWMNFAQRIGNNI